MGEEEKEIMAFADSQVSIDGSKQVSPRFWLLILYPLASVTIPP